MNKLDEYDAQKLIKAKEFVEEVRSYNYTSESSRLYRKLSTIINKLEAILCTELEPELQKEYNLSRRI